MNTNMTFSNLSDLCVFADWLEIEAGEIGRAQAIRMHVSGEWKKKLTEKQTAVMRMRPGRYQPGDRIRHVTRTGRMNEYFLVGRYIRQGGGGVVVIDDHGKLRSFESGQNYYFEDGTRVSSIVNLTQEERIKGG